MDAAQLVRMLAAKPDALSLIPRTHMTERTTLSSCPPVCTPDTACAHMHHMTGKKKKGTKGVRTAVWIIKGN